MAGEHRRAQRSSKIGVVPISYLDGVAHTLAVDCREPAAKAPTENKNERDCEQALIEDWIQASYRTNHEWARSAHPPVSLALRGHYACSRPNPAGSMEKLVRLHAERGRAFLPLPAPFYTAKPAIEKSRCVECAGPGD
jgi:hypothetical protein